MRNLLPAILLACTLTLACDSGNPVSPTEPTPSSSTYRVTISVSPSSLEVGTSDSGTITISVVRLSDNQPPDDGTSVTVSTDLGNFGTDSSGPITLVRLSLTDGRVQTTLFPGDEAGTASLLAQVGDSVAEGSVEIAEPAAPVVVEAVPNVGSPDGGDRVVIEGEGFKEPLTVRFGAAAAQVTSVPNSRQVVVLTPPSTTPVEDGAAVAVDVTVTTRLDLSEPLSTTLTGGFTYSQNAGEPFYVIEVDPNTGDADGGTAVAVLGEGFRWPLRVDFGGALAQVREEDVSYGRIDLTTPASPMSVAAGESLKVDVTVTQNLDESSPSTAVLPGGFTYTAGAGPALFLTEVQPDRGEGGIRVRIHGGGFLSPVRVEFAGRPGTNPQVVNSGEIRVTVPEPESPVAAGETQTVDVTVTNDLNGDGASVTLANGFTYTGGVASDPPQVFSVVPSSGSNDGGTLVEITGLDFEDPVDVFFGGVGADTAEITFVSPTKLEAVTPAAGANRNMTVDVVVRNRSSGLMGTLAGGFTYTGVTLVISSMDPATGLYTGGTAVTVVGEGFEDPASVELGGVLQDDVDVISSKELTFTTVGVAVEECPMTGVLEQTGLKVTNLANGDSVTADLSFDYTVSLPRIREISPTFGPQLGNQTVNLEGEGFESPVRVVFAKEDTEFAAAIQRVEEDLVVVTSPRVPDSLFDEVACTTGGGESGMQYVNTMVDVKVIHLNTGCEDVFTNAYTYAPSNTGCRAGS